MASFAIGLLWCLQVKRWCRTEPANCGYVLSPMLPAGSTRFPGGCSLPEVEAHITGTIWKIEVEVGDHVGEGDTVVILESMKMEMPVEAEDGGVVKAILVEEGQSVSEGDTLVVLE